MTGCSKVSPGCDNCYAEALTMRFAQEWGVPGLPWDAKNAAQNVILKAERLDQPKRWRRPRMVFVNSMSDLFHPRVPRDYIAQVFDVMEACPQHIFQILTKRPKRMATWARKFRPEPLPNVWLGTSIESHEYIERADALRYAPAAVRFISAEPLLGPLAGNLSLRDIDWLIVGGESGPGYRPLDLDWVRSLRDDAVHAGTAFFFKQIGGIRPKANGRELDGRTWDELP